MSEPIPDGVELLNAAHAVLTDYVVLPTPEAADAMVLWVAVTHALPAFDCAPRLAIASPTKRCGKSRLLDVLIGISHNPLVAISATTPAIYRSLGGEHPPALFIDEADTIWGSARGSDGNEDLRALLNAGFQRGKPVLRCVGPDSRPTEFPTFAAAALAGIGQLPDTITDRAINVTMRRRTPYEAVLPFRTRRDGPRLTQLREQLQLWTASEMNTLAQHTPDMPLEDREADTWEPLIVIADIAGGHWPQRARTAALLLTETMRQADGEHTGSIRLLRDIRDIFSARTGDFLPTGELLGALKSITDAPWMDSGLTATKLAGMLAEFGIRPGSTGTQRGYRRHAFTDTFHRYLPPADVPLERAEGPPGVPSKASRVSEPPLDALTG